MAHQAISLEHDAKSPIVYDTSDAGTGKTFVRIVAFAQRRRRRGGKLLVLANRSLLRAVWLADFRKFAPDMKVSVANADNREAAFREEADVYVTNHDAVKWLVKQHKNFLAQFTELVIDESTAFKHHTSQRSKALAKIAHMPWFKNKSAMTGTPNGNSITDVWHQVFVLDKGKRLGSSFYAFRNTVCVPEQIGRNVNAIQWKDRDGAEEAVFDLLSDIVVRHRFEDCVDIPQNNRVIVEYELTPAQRKTYDVLERDHFLPYTNTYDPQVVASRLQGKKVAPQISITAINAAAVATKLLQVASGAVYDNDSKPRIIDTARYELIMEMASERRHPLIFFLWQHQRDLLVAEAESRGMTYGVIDGSATDKERDGLVARYQAGMLDVLFAHPRSAGHGLTLTRGSSTIWASPTYDAELFQQGNRRQVRIGQKNKTETIVMLAKDTIEEKVYQILEGKNARMRTLLDLFSSNFDLGEEAP